MPAHVIQELFAITTGNERKTAQSAVVGKHFLELAPVFA